MVQKYADGAMKIQTDVVSKKKRRRKHQVEKKHSDSVEHYTRISYSYFNYVYGQQICSSNWSRINTMLIRICVHGLEYSSNGPYCLCNWETWDCRIVICPLHYMVCLILSREVYLLTNIMCISNLPLTHCLFSFLFLFHRNRDNRDKTPQAYKK